MTALTLPAYSLLTGDRVCLYGTWHTVGAVTVHNELPEGATVHVTLDHGSTDADLNAHDTYEVQRAVTLTQTPSGMCVREERAGRQEMTPDEARQYAMLLISAADDADAANGDPIGTMPGIPDDLRELLGGAA